MNFHTKFFAFVVLLCSVPTICRSNVTISVIRPPATPNDWFDAVVMGASAMDPTPNPCYQKKGCELRFFTIAEQWLPAGKDGYNTYDLTSWNHNGSKDDSYATLGEWWSTVTNKDRVGHDYLTGGYGPHPCVVLAAWTYQSKMQRNTIVSNCARGLVQVPICNLSPGQINVTFDTAAGSEPGEQIIPNVRLSCTMPVSLRIETNSSEELPLGGDNTSVAILDWGNGYGRPGAFDMGQNESRPVMLKVKTRGIARLEPGSYSGSGIVNITYE